MRAARSLRLAALAGGLALLAACGRDDLAEAPADLGPFRLGLNIVVADNMQRVPISREATVEEWEAGIQKAIADRFGRYDGDRFYNIGIAVDGYALAPPGIPVVAAPKSVVVVTANIWDDATQTRLNPEGKQFTIFENLSGETVIGSGLTSTREEQLEALSFNVARAVEGWLVENPQWFAASGAVPGNAPPRNDPAPTLMSRAAPPAVETTALPPSGAPAAPILAPGATENAAPAANPLVRPLRRPGSAPLPG